jgi:hypothetical protein
LLLYIHLKKPIDTFVNNSVNFSELWQEIKYFLMTYMF